MIACSHCFVAISGTSSYTYYIYDGNVYCPLCWINSGACERAAGKSGWEFEEMFKRNGYEPNTARKEEA